MADSKAGTQLAATDLLEEAIALLRRTPASLFLAYYLGAVPFWLKLLSFITEMSLSGAGRGDLVGSSLQLSLLFLWMKCWQTVFASSLLSSIASETPPPWTLARIARMTLSQAQTQFWGVLLRPLAYATIVSGGWISAFFHHLTTFGDGREKGDGTLVGGAWRVARLRPVQLHGMIAALLLFSAFVWGNVIALILVLPSLAKMATGWESMATRNTSAMLNSTFFAISFAVAALCVSPIWSAAFVVRAFHVEAMSTGADLLARLKKLRGSALALGMLCALAPGAIGQTSPPAPANTVDAGALDRSLEQVFTGREFVWRSPAADAGAAESRSVLGGWAHDAGVWIVKTTDEAWRSITKFFRGIYEKWFKGNDSRGTAGSHLELPPVRTLVWIATILVSVVLAYLGWRTWRRPRRRAHAIAVSPVIPDLEADETSAEDLPEEGWVRLTVDLVQSGQMRLAMRAAYLAGLAHLGSGKYLSIARYKSNLDYRRELQRRARSRADLLDAFVENVASFERAWYGRHEVTPGEFERFKQNLETIRAC